jgi:hypothetical protein
MAAGSYPPEGGERRKRASIRHRTVTKAPWLRHGRGIDDARMERVRQLGEVTNYEVPDWAPLEGALDQALVGWFMWMHEVRLADGTTLHAYKHQATRRYLYLGVSGGASYYDEDGMYVPLPVWRAIDAAFESWPRLGGTPADMDLVTRARMQAVERERRRRTDAAAA